MKKGEWTFLTNHGHVLAFIAKHPHSTTQEIAIESGITLRAVQKILNDLEDGGYISRKKEGRRNSYTVDPLLPMRHQSDKGHVVGDMLRALGYDPRVPNEFLSVPME